MPAEERPVGVRGRWLDYAAVAVALAILAACLHSAGDRPLTWDEVDYVVAARAGTWANLTDRGAMGPVTFARFALAKVGWGDAEEVARAAGYVEDESLLHLRHSHPPAGLFLLPPAISAAGPERGARLMQLALATLLALLMVALLRDLAPERGLLRAGAVLVVLLDPLTRHSLLEAHVHVAVAAAFLLPLWAWLRATRVPLDARRLGELQEAGAGRPTAPMGGRWGALVMGMALGVLWSAAVVGPLWTGLWIGCLGLHRDARAWLGRGGGALWLAAGVLAVLLVLWPGAFVKVSLLQTYALRVYALLFQGGREWGSAAAALVTFVRQEPNLMLYALLGVTALGVGLVRGRRDALGTGAATVAFLIVIVPFAIIDRYLLPLVPLAVLAGVALVGSGDPEWPTPLRSPARGGCDRPARDGLGVGSGLRLPRRALDAVPAGGVRARKRASVRGRRSAGRGRTHISVLCGTGGRRHAVGPSGLRRPPPAVARRRALRHGVGRSSRLDSAPEAEHRRARGVRPALRALRPRGISHARAFRVRRRRRG